VSLFDIPATVFDALGMNTQDVGRPVFSVREDEKRPRFAYPLDIKKSNRQGDKELSRCPLKFSERLPWLFHATFFVGADCGSAGGAFEYEINGDAQNPLSWKTTYQFLRLHKGKTNIDPIEYQSRANELSEHLDDPERYNIREWSKK
jgi:hypothetical protein